jgi:hypothetical protein
MKIPAIALLEGRRTRALIMELYLFRLGARNAIAKTRVAMQAARPLDITSAMFVNVILNR